MSQPSSSPPALTAGRLVARLAAMGLTQEALSRALGYSPRQVTAWATGEDAIPRWVDLALLALETNPDRRPANRRRGRPPRVEPPAPEEDGPAGESSPRLSPPEIVARLDLIRARIAVIDPGLAADIGKQLDRIAKRLG